jgi:hypothetical protein
MPAKPKAKKSRPKKSSKAQSERFIAKAKELGVDETGADFQQLFERIVKPNKRPDR